MRGREFVAVASFLQRFETESSLRAQTGRLYYAAYLEARSWCEEHLGYTRVRSSREHAEVSTLLGAVDAELSDTLAFLRTLRNAADYDMDLSLETVELQVEDARILGSAIIARLDELATPGTDA